MGHLTVLAAQLVRSGWLIALLPCLLAAWLILPRMVNTPLWDDWERGPLLQKWYAGTLGWQDLAAGHINHRIIIPRLATLALNDVTRGDMRYELGLIFCAIAATAIGFVWLALRQGASTGKTLSAFLICALLVSPMQFQSYLWASSLGLVLPSTFMFLAIAAWLTSWPLRARWVAVVLASLAASGVFAHGLGVWPIMLLVILLSSRGGGPRSKAIAGGLYLLIGAMVIGLSLHDLKNTSHPLHAYGADDPDLKTRIDALKQEPARHLAFFLRLLGSPLARSFNLPPREAGVVLGAILLALLAACAAVVLARRKERDLWELALPILALGGFAVLSALGVALGRGGFLSPVRGLSNRYITLTQMLPAVLLILIPLLGARFLKPDPARRLGYFGGGVCFMLIALTWIAALEPLNAWHHARLQGQAEVTVIHIAQRPSPKLSDGDSGFLKAQATFLDEHGLLRPPLLKEPWLDGFTMSPKPVSLSRGHSNPPLVEAGSVIFSGLAKVPGSGRPADAVLICSSENGRWRIRAIADSDYQPGTPLLSVDYEFTGRHHPTYRIEPGWRATIPREIYNQSQAWSAWILDIKKRKVYLLPPPK